MLIKLFKKEMRNKKADSWCKQTQSLNSCTSLILFQGRAYMSLPGLEPDFGGSRALVSFWREAPGAIELKGTMF